MNTVSGKNTSEEVSIIHTRIFSYIPWLNKFLSDIPRFKKIDSVIQTAGIKRPLGFFVLLSFFLGSLGFLGGWVVGKKLILGILGAGFLGILPFFYILFKKRKRMKLFQKQFPDVLDLLSRSLKAGHSIPAGIRMVADEFPDPIGTEFKEIASEIYYGLNLYDALHNLTKRVDCEDLGFFITSIIIQRDTGGNLAEMMDSIAHIIRERFKLLAKVKALAAEGVLSAWLLSLLPFAVGTFIFMTNQGYMSLLFNDPLGQKIFIGATIWLFLGILFMTRMTNIKI
ncbi:MAG: type II secretion system F family protein [Thermodesulfobacteriota bacterium]|nr:type II secretion system F family protein [Thermodesulfobacteriota bacterium]